MKINMAARLKMFFMRNGYYRIPHKATTGTQKQSYKKGYEVRLVAGDYKEFIEIRKLLRASGFTPGKAFLKGRRKVIPVYGKQNYEAFKKLMKDTKNKKAPVK